MERRGRRRRRNRFLRVALVLTGTVAATGLVGFGGLAAWQGYTDNAGNSVAAGSLSHNNTAGGQTCTSVNSLTQLNQSGNVCGAIVSVSGVSPSSPDPPTALVSGGVQIVSTGALASALSMQMPSAASGNLCPDLQLTVVDARGVTVYSAAPLSTQMGSPSPISLADSAGTSTWPGTSPGPAGSNTFTFQVTKGPNFNTDSADQGQSCTFSVLFAQQA